MSFSSNSQRRNSQNQFFLMAKFDEKNFVICINEESLAGNNVELVRCQLPARGGNVGAACFACDGVDFSLH